MKILLVDDSPSARKLISAYVNALGYYTIEAHDAEQALALYRSERPDLVLTDVEMPGLNGYGLAREIRRLDNEDDWVPILFLSSHVADENIAHGLDAGGDDYIAKPVSPVVLGAKLKAMRRITQMREKLLLVSRDLRLANRELLKLSSQDPLTELANRRCFDRTLEREWRRSQTCRESMALLMCDVDHFKRYNDHYGHGQGDTCLKHVARALGETAKVHGRGRGILVARYGGEEFIVLLPQSSDDAALSMGCALLDGVRRLGIAHAGSETDTVVTLSVGISCGVPSVGDRFESLVLRADDALYRSKADGRNRCSYLALNQERDVA